MKKVMMKGNEAIGEAAIQAGCRNYFGYPITPQSEVAEYLSRRLPDVGGVFLQGESEIAVVNMVHGAASCGERVFTTSSSPGISLMSEGISYIAGAEVPAVFVNIVRGGPGLGGILPSQADYLQATKGGGHGDYHLLVMAPAGVQETAEMVMQAFPLAEKYRNPVMILGDGLIGQMMEPVYFPEHLITEPANKDAWATNGKGNRADQTPNVIKTLYLDPAVLEAHNLKLKAKYERMAREELQYEEYHLECDYQSLIVAYGTMSRVCRSAIVQLQADGVDVGMIRPQTLFPFPREAIKRASAKKSCRNVVSIEMSMGQMMEDVERSVGHKKEVLWYGRCGGDIPTADEVCDFIVSSLK